MKEFKQVGIRDVNVDESRHYPELDNTTCPCCGKGPLNGATGISVRHEYKDILPEDGSPTFCCFCSSLCVFRKDEDGKLSLDQATQEEIAEFKADPECWRMLIKIQKVIEKMATKEQLKGNKDYAKFKPKRY